MKVNLSKWSLCALTVCKSSRKKKSLRRRMDRAGVEKGGGGGLCQLCQVTESLTLNSWVAFALPCHYIAAFQNHLKVKS